MKKNFYNIIIKRCLDLFIALIITIILMPFLLLFAILIIFESGLPIIYKGNRCGYKGKIFKIYKFRSMVKNAENLGGGTTALNDRRITKVGNFLRKTKIDELPQLINIIKGEMSFIGPRPELIKYTNSYRGDELLILKVRPGMSDYSSCKFINLDELVGHDNADEMYEKIILHKKNRMRIKYAKTISFETDLRLFTVTFLTVIKKVIVLIGKFFKAKRN